MTFSNGTAKVIEANGDLILAAKRDGKLYTVSESLAMLKLAKATDTGLWHRRLDHLHHEAVEKLSHSGRSSQDAKCSTCALGKLKRSSFPKKGGTRAKAPLELVHSDVVGKITPASKGGSNYFVTFIDDYSRFTVEYPMKAKNEVLDRFDQYRRMVENLDNMKVKTLRSDNGGEYTSKEFDDYRAKHGIKRRLTIPGTPDQNGVTERMNQTLHEMTRCLLIQSGGPKELWADAVVTASRIRNKCSSKAVEGESPEALWKGGEVKLDHLRVFGCRTWCLRNRRCKRSKLDPKAEECILVGYPEGVKVYKLWNQKEDRFFVSWDVTFEEDSFPCKLAQAPSTDVEICGDTEGTIMFQVEDSWSGHVRLVVQIEMILAKTMPKKLAHQLMKTTTELHSRYPT